MTAIGTLGVYYPSPSSADLIWFPRPEVHILEVSWAIKRKVHGPFLVKCFGTETRTRKWTVDLVHVYGLTAWNLSVTSKRRFLAAIRDHLAAEVHPRGLSSSTQSIAAVIDFIDDG
jgi:hypothetical protein